MDKYIENRVQKLVEKMEKGLKSKGKNLAEKVVDEVLDGDSIAETPEDKLAPDSSSAVNKSQKKKMEKCKDVDDCDCDCECDESPAELEKGEKLIKDIISKFEVISKAYLAKMEKNRMATRDELAPKRKQKQLEEKQKQIRESMKPWKNAKLESPPEERNINNITPEMKRVASRIGQENKERRKTGSKMATSGDISGIQAKRRVNDAMKKPTLSEGKE